MCCSITTSQASWTFINIYPQRKVNNTPRGPTEYFCYFCSKMYVVDTQWNCLDRAIPVSTASCEQEREKTYRHSLMSFFVVCILVYNKSSKRRFWSECGTAQTDRNCHWAHMSECTFSDFMTLFSVLRNYSACPLFYCQKIQAFDRRL